MKKIEVTWLDAWHQTGETTLKEVADMKPLVRRDLGYLLKMSKAEVIIASGMVERIPGGEDSFVDISIIPRAMVKGILSIDLSNNND